MTRGGGRDAWGDVNFLAPLAGLVCVVVLLSVGSVSTEAGAASAESAIANLSIAIETYLSPAYGWGP